MQPRFRRALPAILAALVSLVVLRGAFFGDRNRQAASSPHQPIPDLTEWFDTIDATFSELKSELCSGEFDKVDEYLSKLEEDRIFSLRGDLLAKVYAYRITSEWEETQGCDRNEMLSKWLKSSQGGSVWPYIIRARAGASEASMLRGGRTIDKVRPEARVSSREKLTHAVQDIAEALKIAPDSVVANSILVNLLRRSQPHAPQLEEAYQFVASEVPSLLSNHHERMLSLSPRWSGNPSSKMVEFVRNVVSDREPSDPLNILVVELHGEMTAGMTDTPSLLRYFKDGRAAQECKNICEAVVPNHPTLVSETVTCAWIFSRAAAPHLALKYYNQAAQQKRISAISMQRLSSTRKWLLTTKYNNEVLPLPGDPISYRDSIAAEPSTREAPADSELRSLADAL